MERIYLIPHGIDTNLSLLKEAIKKLTHNALILCSADYLSFRDKIFNFITCFGLIEHLKPLNVLKETYRILKNGGEKTGVILKKLCLTITAVLVILL